MKLVVFSHKVCWRSTASNSGFATDGGFPFQMKALSEIFDKTVLVLPFRKEANTKGESSLTGHNLSVATLSEPFGRGVWRKILFPVWCLLQSPVLISRIVQADVIHAPIPGDVGTVGMILGLIFKKPLFVRHCGNWSFPRTFAEKFWKWFMETFAGGRNIMLTTGGGDTPPSLKNSNIQWIFSTTLTEKEIENYAKPRSAPGHPARLIIVCRQEREKGTGVLIESLPAILKKLPVVLDIVGNGSALPQFKEAVNRLQLSEQVTFHGNMKHGGVLELLEKADLFCYPTFASEGFPKSVHEAMACGLPIVTTPVSVLRSLLNSGCGILIERADPQLLATAVKKCLSDQEAYCRMSRQAIKTSKQYSLEKWQDQLQENLKMFVRKK